MDNYAHDIFVNEGLPFIKMSKMLSNLKEIAQLEASAAVEILEEVYKQPTHLFLN